MWKEKGEEVNENLEEDSRQKPGIILSLWNNLFPVLVTGPADIERYEQRREGDP